MPGSSLPIIYFLGAEKAEKNRDMGAIVCGGVQKYMQAKKKYPSTQNKRQINLKKNLSKKTKKKIPKSLHKLLL